MPEADVPVRIKDFAVTPIDAWRVSCHRCSAATIVTGMNADYDAVAWAQSHLRNNHREEPSSDDVG